MELAEEIWRKNVMLSVCCMQLAQMTYTRIKLHSLLYAKNNSGCYFICLTRMYLILEEISKTELKLKTITRLFNECPLIKKDKP